MGRSSPAEEGAPDWPESIVGEKRRRVEPSQHPPSPRGSSSRKTNRGQSIVLLCYGFRSRDDSRARVVQVHQARAGQSKTHCLRGGCLTPPPNPPSRFLGHTTQRYQKVWCCCKLRQMRHSSETAALSGWRFSPVFSVPPLPQIGQNSYYGDNNLTPTITRKRL